MRQSTEEKKSTYTHNIRIHANLSANNLCKQYMWTWSNKITAVWSIAFCDTSHLYLIRSLCLYLFLFGCVSWFNGYVKCCLAMAYVTPFIWRWHTVVCNAFRAIFMNFTNQTLHFNIYSMRVTRHGGSLLLYILMLGKLHLHTFGRFAWIASDGCAPCKMNKRTKIQNSE